MRVGDPLDKNTDVGAINSKMQLNKIKELVQAGIDEGATFYQSQCELPQRGYWFRPTFFSDVAQSHRIANEEIFGPVLSILHSGRLLKQLKKQTILFTDYQPEYGQIKVRRYLKH